MSTTPGYYRTSRGKVRYRTAEPTLSPENTKHRDRQTLHRAPTRGRVARTDRGALRVAARQEAAA